MRDKDVMYNIACLMVASPHDVNAIKTFTRFLKDCIANKQLGDPVAKQWRSVVNEYMRRISNFGEQDFLQHEWTHLADVLCSLEQNRYHGVLECAGECFYRAKEHGHAVKCWEQCGDTQKHEYYLAKAEVCSFPDGLEWLGRANDHEGIIMEWEKAGGLERASAHKWLKFVGPALEKKSQHWKAVAVYMRLSDIPKLLDCFAKGSKKVAPSDLWEKLVHLVKYLVCRDRWIDALDAVDEYETAGSEAARVELRYYVVHELASSGLTPESIPRDQRQLYEKFIDRALKVNDWQRHLSPQEVGAALERTCNHNKAVEFYSRFLDDSKLQQFARQRWTLNKRRQEKYFREQGQKGRAEQIRIELSNRAYDWGIRLDRLDDLPYYPTLRLEKEKEFADRRGKYLIGHIEVIFLRQEKLVLLIDTRNLTTLRVDLKEGKVTGQEVEHTATRRRGKLLFDVPESGYRGTAFYGAERPRIELTVQGLASTYTIDT